MRLSAALLVALVVAATGCGSGDGDDDDDDVPPGPAPVSCDGVFDSEAECPSPSQLCTPQSCGAYDCCYWVDGAWHVTYTDCFEGCPGNVDAPDDAPDDAPVDAPDDGPPHDGCGAFDAGIAHC